MGEKGEIPDSNISEQTVEPEINPSAKAFLKSFKQEISEINADPTRAAKQKAASEKHRVEHDAIEAEYIRQVAAGESKPRPSTDAIRQALGSMEQKDSMGSTGPIDTKK